MADQLTKMQKTLVAFETAAATAVGATIIFGQSLSDKVAKFLMPEFQHDHVLNALRPVSAANDFTVQQAQDVGAYVGYGTVIVVGAVLGGAICALGLKNKKAVQGKFQSNEQDMFYEVTGSALDAAIRTPYSYEKNSGPV